MDRVSSEDLTVRLPSSYARMKLRSVWFPTSPWSRQLRNLGFIFLGLLGASLWIWFQRHTGDEVWLPTCLTLSSLWGLVVVLRTVEVQDTLMIQRDITTHGYDASPYAYLIFDAEGSVVFMNKKVRTLFRNREIKSLHDVLSAFEDDPRLSQALKHLRTLKDQRKHHHVDVPIEEKGQTLSWWRISVSPLADSPHYTVWCLADITPSREEAWDLAFDPAFTNTLLNLAPAGYFVLDAQDHILYTNQKLCEWLETEPKSIVHQDIHAWFDKPSYSLSLRQHCDQKPVVLSFRTRTGRVHDYVVSRFSVNLNNGTSSYFVLKDLTRDGELQQALEESRHHFENIFENAPVGIVLINDQHLITGCNRTFRHMAQMEDAHAPDTELTLLDYIHRDDREKLVKRLKEDHLRTNPETSVSTEIRLKGQHMAALFINPFVETHTEPPKERRGYVLYFMDMTEQKKLEFQFAQSQKMQAVGQLAGGIAHDFNNLLTAIIGFCDLLLQRHSPADSSFGDMMQIKQNANRAANLVRQLLAFSRQQTLQPKVLNITDVLAELTALLRRLLGASIELDIHHGRDLPLIKVDQGQLEQVIINLSVNARDAMPHGGTLRVSTQTFLCTQPKPMGEDVMEPGTYVLVQVQDTGTGISPDHITRIFEPFFSTKEIGSGTGLGLSTVYGIIKQTGGFIHVASEMQKGTLFSIYLPSHAASQEATQPDVSEPKKEKISVDLTGQGTILLAEDEDAVRMFSARALREKGYRVIEAHSGEKALEYLTQTQDPVDLLITDVVMPKMDGTDLIKNARAHCPHLKVIFISGYTEDNFRKKLDHQDVAFLAKPFTLRDLASKVKEVLYLDKPREHAPPPSRRRRAGQEG